MKFFSPFLLGSKKISKLRVLCAEVSYTKISVHFSKKEKIILLQQLEHITLAKFLGEILAPKLCLLAI